MALLTGLTDQGVEVPVQVTPAGVLVAEGLQGQPGPPGNDGAAEVGDGFVILQGAGPARVMCCWGSVVSSDTDFVYVTYPRAFLSPPVVVVSDHDKGVFGGDGVFIWQIERDSTTTSVGFACIRMAINAGVTGPFGGKKGDWIAWGPVA